jgi:ABC-type sugar transport system ATPase subunit
VQMRAEVARVQRDLGVTTIYVTHDQVEAMTMGDRVAVMRKGELQQVADPQTLYDEPVNLFVGGFIGSPSMNMLEATLEQANGTLTAVAGSQRVHLDEETLSARPALQEYVGRRVILGIRPEDIEDVELAATMVYVTHDQVEAMTLGDRIVVMHEGRIQQAGSPLELYERPANRFVATFVGSPAMSVLAASVEECLHIGHATITLDGARRDACRAGQAEAIGIRAEDISLIEPGGASLSGEIYVIEPMGNETLVDLRINGERLTVRAPRGFSAPIGSTAGVTFDPANACFFDKAGNTVVHRAPNKGETS